MIMGVKYSDSDSPVEMLEQAKLAVADLARMHEGDPFRPTLARAINAAIDVAINAVKIEGPR
jgi:hypothetical protein